MNNEITIAQNAEEALSNGLDWVKQNISDEQGCEGIHRDLRSIRREIKKLKNTADLPPTLAVFGASQAGKSYLVNSLISRPGGNAEILFGQRRIDFLKEINPVGGKESTGAVTRFTIHYHGLSEQKPVKLIILTQIDLVKIIGHGYLANIRPDTRNDDITTQTLQSIISKFHGKKNKTPIDGLDPDDLFDLREYMNKEFPNDALIAHLNRMQYWEEGARLLPYISALDRLEYFEILWGRSVDLGTIFSNLSAGLKQIQFSTEIQCGSDALVPKNISIIDVQIVKYLFETDTYPPVTAYLPQGPSVSIKRGVLTGLVKEIVLNIPEDIINVNNRSLFQEVDVLDFPGARSYNDIPLNNLAITPNENSHTQNLGTGKEVRGKEALYEVYLRGKVAFLFHCYTNEYAINALIICQQDGPPEVMTLPKFVEKWIHRTQGRNAQERTGKPSSLFWVCSKFDRDLTSNPAASDDNPSEYTPLWDARFNVNFKEYVQKQTSDQWINHWDNTKSFENCFWIRNPYFSSSVIDSKEGIEFQLKPEKELRLRTMKTSYVQFVKQSGMFFENPDRAWDEAVQPAKSGVEYLIEKVTPICNKNIKQKQVQDQLIIQKNNAFEILKPYRKSTDIQELIREAESLGQKTVEALLAMMKFQNSFGFLLDALMMTEEVAWQTFFDLDFQYQGETEEYTPLANHHNTPINLDDSEFESEFGDIFNNISQSTSNANPSTNINSPVFRPKENRFVIALLGVWNSNLRISEERYQQWGLTKEAYSYIIRGLTESVERVRLAKIMEESIKPLLDGYAEETIDLIARMSVLLLNKFTNTVSWGYVEEEKRPKLKSGKSVFSSEILGVTEEPNLDVKFPGQAFFMQWLKGIQECFKANVLYQQNQPDLDNKTLIANAELIKIMDSLK
ncbi:MAG: hypothetical protein HQM12_19915 [SAR324 cluster bacterium]|nr:hypothetical protein [SAR324 cluster bacterium]